ncbi:hypothetical protein BN2475_120181 [Paraburkholderia ribeironis]|uniref:Uncharacterized protein n=1 Tax=Paraburkholderia ribeironis TaxID=1247936 RepID=A0A1N7RST5_9BURK|nr:hypothetical protein BN2475_120181 [Paraburkholderia ribeironis]
MMPRREHQHATRRTIREPQFD